MIGERLAQPWCGSARPGLRWAIMVFTLVGCLSLHIAFAQSRPPTSDTKAEPVENQTGSTFERMGTDWPDYIIPGSMMRFRLTDPNGLPAAGVQAGEYATMRAPTPSEGPGQVVRTRTSDEQGEVLLEESEISTRKLTSPNDIEEVRTKKKPWGAVCLLHGERQLGAIQGIAQEDGGKTFDVRLQPLCRVRGTLTGPGLPAAMPLRHVSAEAEWRGIRVFRHFSERHRLDFPLPPGEYVLRLHGEGYVKEPCLAASTMWETLSVKITEGQRHLNLGDIRLRPTKLATMIGQPALELGPIAAWKNGPSVTIAQLRGRVVILYFGGQYPRASGELSALVRLHETFADQGLTILAIYNCVSLEELEQRWPSYDPQLGSMEKVPFRIVLDGGERTGRERFGATYEKYGQSGPTANLTVLIDRAGVIAGEYHYSYPTGVLRQMLDLQE